MWHGLYPLNVFRNIFCIIFPLCLVFVLHCCLLEWNCAKQWYVLHCSLLKSCYSSVSNTTHLSICARHFFGDLHLHYFLKNTADRIYFLVPYFNKKYAICILCSHTSLHHVSWTETKTYISIYFKMYVNAQNKPTYCCDCMGLKNCIVRHVFVSVHTCISVHKSKYS